MHWAVHWSPHKWVLLEINKHSFSNDHAVVNCVIPSTSIISLPHLPIFYYLCWLQASVRFLNAFFFIICECTRESNMMRIPNETLTFSSDTVIPYFLFKKYIRIFYFDLQSLLSTWFCSTHGFLCKHRNNLDGTSIDVIFTNSINWI